MMEDNDRACIEWGDWLKLMHYFEHELEEGEITNQTYETMTSALMSFKPHIEISYEIKEVSNG